MQLDPINIQGLHNLCVVYVERGKLVQAQSCLTHAHNLAPSEDYIIKHLQIVQSRIGRFRQQPANTKEKEIALSTDFDPKEYGGDSNSIIIENDNNKINNIGNDNIDNHNQINLKSPPNINNKNSNMNKKQKSKLNDPPIFVESETMSSNLQFQNDYRSSNSNNGQNNKNNNNNHNDKYHINRHFSNSNNHRHNHNFLNENLRKKTKMTSLEDTSRGGMS